MNNSYNQIQTSIDIAQLIAKARDAEITRDMGCLKELLGPIWSDFERKPDLHNFEPKIRAELLRICGYFLTAYGTSQTVKNYQERGKDLVTEAIDLFEELDLPHEVGRAKALLASIYYYQGQIEETEIILDEASLRYENNQLHPVNLLISVLKIGALVWKLDFQVAYKILQDIQIPMELCEDKFLLSRYHNQAGIIYSRIGKFVESQQHYEKAISYGLEINNQRYVGNNLNNLALTYMRQGRLDEAKIKIDEAIELFGKLNEKGWLATAFDTKAQIQLRANQIEDGIVSIECSIELFSQGEFYGALTDAIWVKIHLLLRLERKEDAVMLFADLAKLAKTEIGEYAVRKYAIEFAKIIHVKKGTDFFGEVQAFKRNMLMEALVDANADISKAAKKLNADHSDLTRVLNREFPDIYLELGISPQMMSSTDNRKVLYY